MQVIAQSMPLQRLQFATDLLLEPSCREQRQNLQKILGNWDVRQWKDHRNREYDEVRKDMETKVIQETIRLQRLETVSGARVSFSAIAAVLQPIAKS
jgi:hypothetical protein